MIAACISTASHSSNDASTKQQLQTLNHGISKLEQWLKTAQTQKSGLQAELQQSEKEAGRITGQIREVEKNIEETRNRLGQLNVQRDQLIIDRARQENLLAGQIRTRYYLGNQEYIKALLSQDQPEQLARTLKYYDYFNKARIRQIAAHNTILEQLKLNQQAIETQNQALIQANEALLSQQDQLSLRRKERSAILLELQGDIKDSDTELANLLKNRKQLEQLLRAVEEKVPAFEFARGSRPIKELKGKLPWPTRGKVVHRYGTTDQQTGTQWSGLLISAAEGQDIQAVHRGHVVFADWLRGYGLLIIIDHGEGYMSLYGHNQAIYKKSGDSVKAGEVIGGVGNSGGMQQTHLYFEIRSNGKTQDPQQWMVVSK